MRAKLHNLIDMLNARSFLKERHDHALSIVRWAAALIPMAMAVGSLCAAFLWSLDAATRARFDHPWLLFLLPIGGGAVGLLYRWLGNSVEGGNNLIVEQIHEPGGGVPLRMAPLILFGTIVTHLFGGSAGREGTAVQLGGSLASSTAALFRLDQGSIRILLMAGIAAGFGAVFGTPLAGAIFALEVLAVGRVEYRALVPCLVAGVVGDWTCHAWGIEHTLYKVGFVLAVGDKLLVEPLILVKAAVAGVVFGLVGLAFAEANHVCGDWMKRLVRFGPLRPVVGGLAVVAMVYLFDTRAYLGLGVWTAIPGDPTLPGFFSGPVDQWSWLLKFIFTVATLSAGFKGGEVTPLFFIGAALGNALSGILGGPVDLFAAMGFVALFASAANTPLACFVAYLCSGHSGIYLSQRVAVAKRDDPMLPSGATLREVRAARRKPARRTGNILPTPRKNDG